MKTIKKIIIRPVITEKSMSAVEANNVYTFLVENNSNKIEVKNEVESMFNVTVNDVRMINVLGKKVRFGKNRLPGKRNSYKKAIVTLKQGDKISAFEIK